MYISLDYFYFWQYLKKHFRVLLGLKEGDISKPENGTKAEHTGISRINAIENELKNKKKQNIIDTKKSTGYLNSS